MNLDNFCLSIAIKLVFLPPRGTLLPCGTPPPLDGIPTPKGTLSPDRTLPSDGALSLNGTPSSDETPPDWNFLLVEEPDSWLLQVSSSSGELCSCRRSLHAGVSRFLHPGFLSRAFEMTKLATPSILCLINPSWILVESLCPALKLQCLSYWWRRSVLKRLLPQFCHLVLALDICLGSRAWINFSVCSPFLNFHVPPIGVPSFSFPQTIGVLVVFFVPFVF